jgi:STE24 endopeptidase
MHYTYFAELANPFLIVFLVGTVLNAIVENYIDWTNTRNFDNVERLRKLHSIHPLARKLFTLKKLEKAERYNAEKTQFYDMHTSISSMLTLVCLVFGATPFLLHSVLTLFPSLPIPVSYIIAFFAISVLKAVSDLPFDYHLTFGIEERWGFNRSDRRTYFLDNLKGLLVSGIVMCIMIPLLNWLLTSFGKYTPTGVCGLVGCFILLKMVFEFLWATVGIRLFNKLTPLKNGSLKRRISKLLGKYGYSASSVFVMDSSRRSTKANACIGGIWKSKKIILFDTLLKNHTDDEVVAILGHELAHGKLRHILLNGAISSVTLLATTFITFSFIYDTRLYHAFGYSWITEKNVVEFSLVGFTLATMVIGAVRWILQPMESWISRKMEYAADRYSVKYTRKHGALMTALMKLTSDNLGNVFPSETYERWNYSHPSLLMRLDAIRKEWKNDQGEAIPARHLEGREGREGQDLRFRRWEHVRRGESRPNAM